MNPARIHKKHFTLEQAQSFLKSNKQQLEQLSKLAEILRKKGYDIYRHQYFGGMGPNGDKEHPPELEKLVEILRIFDQDGVLVKEAESGLIDFPFIRENGEEVYLCFKIGEESINYWHSINGGFAGRKLLSEL